jgi:hypothetical protein
MNVQESAEFKVLDHFCLKDRGGFVIGRIQSGLFKIGMRIPINEDGNSLTISGIEFIDILKEKIFANALIFKEMPSLINSQKVVIPEKAGIQ